MTCTLFIYNSRELVFSSSVFKNTWEGVAGERVEEAIDEIGVMLWKRLSSILVFVIELILWRSESNNDHNNS